ncbi:beta-lactamase family protein [Metarhizium rileyi]|uniref:Beta-lactamase family protein n=1 Tax=Metarhizium rileyi (strain RCEF 4871) TaxID=1649241 RepID=A0A166XK48_METRR|nr:beta-lactamase family protein [Metarhizium rileyi RCEF 4871]
MDLFNSPDFSSHVEDLIRKLYVPGLAIAIVHKDITASKAFGVASFDPPKPMTTDTLFDTASASKSLTAAAVALLVHDDEYPDIKYEAEMANLLPGDFVMPGHSHDGVTVEDILSHRSGMASNDNSYMGVRSKNPDTAHSVTRKLRNLATAAPIRSKFIYCNIMFTVATYLVERKTGLTFAEFLHQRFFQPLGMLSTNLQPERARARGLGDRISPGHWWDSKANKYSTFMTPDFPEAQGAGSVVSTVDDYLKYIQAMMNKEGPFTEAIYNGIIKPRIIISPAESPKPFSSPPLYATGWEVHHYRGHMILVHDGCISGSSTSHFFAPGLQLGGAIFGNSDNAFIVAETLMLELIDQVIGLPQDQRINWSKEACENSSHKKNEDRGKDSEADSEADNIEEERQKLCPGIQASEPQDTPLDAYTGEYWNPGWGCLHVQVKSGHLFIDCSDRSYVFTLTFHHVSEQRKYIVLYREVSQGPNLPLRAEFVFDQKVAVKLGIAFDEDLDEYVWFEKAQSETLADLAIRPF